MSSGAIFVGLLFVFGPLILIGVYFHHRYHSDWVASNDSRRLSPNAKIISFNTVPSRDMSFRTTVTFDDGFTFVSHDTKKDVATSFGMSPTSYLLTVTPEMKKQILFKALIAHEKALEKKAKEDYINSLSYKETWAFYWAEFILFLKEYKEENGVIGILAIALFMLLGLLLLCLAIFL